MSTFGNSLKDTYPYIKRAAMILTGYNKPDADDLVQKAFLRALEKQHLLSMGLDYLQHWIIVL
jgi:DNA-directed RNA polymerase specialized sigma24 family protein